jgi:hypothetical protein
MSVLASTPTRRFTIDGNADLERHLGALCRRVRLEAINLVPSPKLEALVLGGGYGRGQGGVLKMESEEAPYNDLEFYVFIAGNHWINVARYRRAFQNLESELSAEAGLHVEFKVDSLQKLRRTPVSIFSYDLVSGHRTIIGTEPVFVGCEYHFDSTKIPATEATRLLLNRCSGLLLARELLLKDSLTDEESDFVGRNLAKAQLALGDALLAAEGKYHWDCLERARRLRKLEAEGGRPLLSRIRPHHDAGVQFKLHPVRERAPIDEFRSQHRELTRLALEVWLWIENKRLQANFSELRDYSLSCVDKRVGGVLWRNLLLNIKTFGAAVTLSRNSRRYPRERLFNALPLLLGDSEAEIQPETRRYLQNQLHTRAKDWPGLVAAYKQLWSCYG